MLASDLISEVIAKLDMSSISICEGGGGKGKNPTAPSITLYSCTQAHQP